MDDRTQTTIAGTQTTFLDLPKEVLLQIFGYFGETFPAHRPDQYHRYRAASQAGDRLQLLNNRLVCREFDKLISPLLCPVAKVSLFSDSIDRFEGLLSNPLIAQGVRGVAISLRFRPIGIANDFRRYHALAVSIVNDAIRECDWHTEFQSYEADDASQAAATHRAYHAAWDKLVAVQCCWRQLFDPERVHAEGPENPETLHGEGKDVEPTEAQRMLKDCFDTYAALHTDQYRIVADGSFVRRVTTAMSFCESPPFVWFNESKTSEDDYGEKGAICLATTEGALSQALVNSHEWLDIESSLYKDDDETDLFFPASIMTDLPIACHDAGVKLRGIQIDCFPLLRGYDCLLPRTSKVGDGSTQDPWARFTAACHNLEIFNFGQRGMTCSPIRPERQSPAVSAIINSFIGAACSGPNLERFGLSMWPFRVRGGRGQDGEHSYKASPILSALTSTKLRSITLDGIETTGDQLLTLLEKIPASHLTDLYFASVTCSHGSYAPVMGLLHDIIVSRRQNKSSIPRIMFNTLQGCEFGAPITFEDDNYSMFGTKEERNGFWDRLLKHQHPDLLKRIEKWLTDGQADDPNPLVSREVVRDTWTDCI